MKNNARWNYWCPETGVTKPQKTLTGNKWCTHPLQTFIPQNPWLYISHCRYRRHKAHSHSPLFKDANTVIVQVEVKRPDHMKHLFCRLFFFFFFIFSLRFYTWHWRSIHSDPSLMGCGGEKKTCIRTGASNTWAAWHEAIYMYICFTISVLYFFKNLREHISWSHHEIPTGSINHLSEDDIEFKGVCDEPKGQPWADWDASLSVVSLGGARELDDILLGRMRAATQDSHATLTHPPHPRRLCILPKPSLDLLSHCHTESIITLEC